jgi:hypothetical protein
VTGEPGPGAGWKANRLLGLGFLCCRKVLTVIRGEWQSCGYGQGFIAVDPEPSTVDIAVLRAFFLESLPEITL